MNNGRRKGTGKLVNILL